MLAKLYGSLSQGFIKAEHRKHLNSRLCLKVLNRLKGVTEGIRSRREAVRLEGEISGDWERETRNSELVLSSGGDKTSRGKCRRTVRAPLGGLGSTTHLFPNLPGISSHGKETAEPRTKSVSAIASIDSCRTT